MKTVSECNMELGKCCLEILELEVHLGEFCKSYDCCLYLKDTDVLANCKHI